MITARSEPHVFRRERSASPHLSCSSQEKRLRLKNKKSPNNSHSSSTINSTNSNSSSTNNNNKEYELDRFMELAHAALEEATKEEDAKGVVQELLERFLARTGAPLMAGAIADQLRSQEVIEQLAEQSFERQRRLLQHSLKKYNNNNKPKAVLSTSNKIKKPTSLPIITSTSTSSSPTSTITPLLKNDEKQNRNRTISLPIKKENHLIPSNSSNSSESSESLSSSPLPSLSLLKQQQSSSISKESLSETSDETVIRDHFVINDDSPSTMSHSSSSTERLLLISEYMWRVFRLLLLASIVGLVYHYVCSFPQHQIYF